MSISKVTFPISMISCGLFIFLVGCRDTSTDTSSKTVDEIVVRLFDEPETISPILATTSLSREVYQYLFVSLADYDYETLELKPILIEEIPEGIISEDGSEIELNMKIKDAAQWSDGSPVTGYDVLTTFKIALHPSIPSRGWKPLLEDIITVEIDPDNPKRMTVRAVNSNFLNKEAILSAQVYPAHIYDPDQIMENVDLTDFKVDERVKEMTEDSTFQAFASKFSSVKWSKEFAEGGGPYQLESWNTGQFLVLKRKPDFWGANFDEYDQLESVPERIIFRFIKDEATALTLLKNEEIDLIDLTRSTYKQFDDLKADSSFSAKFDFHTTQLPRYYFLLMNNEDVRLADGEVRKAIGHLINVDQMIEQIEGGYARRVNSIIHFSKPEYKKDIATHAYDPAKANEMLDKAGWVDSNGDNIRDKMVNGRREKLAFRFHISGSNLSSSVSAIIKEACAQGGIDVEIIRKPNSAAMTENIRPGDYELFLTQRTQTPIKYDPYSGFHSSAIWPQGLNYMRYSNERADALIETIRTTQDENQRSEAYDLLQELINEDLPIILLYSPQLRIVSSNDIQPVISVKRPGFFVNATKEL